MFMQEYELFEK